MIGKFIFVPVTVNDLSHRDPRCCKRLGYCNNAPKEDSYFEIPFCQQDNLCNVCLCLYVNFRPPKQYILTKDTFEASENERKECAL